MIINGIVISLIAGYYDVSTPDGLVRTRARGVFRKRNEKPQVGDSVDVQLDDHGTNYLIKVHERKNRIGRPAVANVSHVLLVMTATQPEFSLPLLDRFLTFFAWQKVPVSIYLSKSDLVDAETLNSIKNDLSYYQEIGYTIYFSKEELENRLMNQIGENEIWTLAGQSGAGKSTLLNALKTDAGQKTAEISQSLNRGKHTTRTVQLFEYGKGFIADTPGFSAIDLSPIKIKELRDYFTEFKAASNACKFRTCQHLHEPKCEVKRLLDAGKIKNSRYESYLNLRDEIEQGRMPEYRK
ncbi:ribosome small subunit-dependent GTPase A [Lactobacillus psittaci]|uniref:Small ribosomal subunit biogenesis GTPase RsgA n=1 Tax=Lactobacillus psittaci DSM 15354 TaxID=1122152 RepID=A0A0R1SBA6_9LACO|nr:ribosome small subunit-dependent GTPase A [Lactobacillus psittaci]KRL63978.1 ribosome small subunit-dependent GTPase A [Lactobacillus psittaci DSM 15354]